MRQRIVHSWHITWVMSLLLLSGSETALFGQAGASGSIRGAVTDPSGALVAGAEIKVKNEATGITNSATTNAAGRYEFAAMAIGNYTVTATAPGFKLASVPNVVLSVGAKYEVNITLTVGEVTQTVEVQAQSPLLQTESNTVSHLVENKTLVEMPLNGRDYQQLQLLTPGVVSGYNFQSQQGLGGGASIGGPSSTLTSNIVNGTRANGTSFLLDGGDTSSQAFRVTQFVPPLDAIAEFSQVSSNAGAEYGYGPTAVNVAVKSGTNQLRGAVWEFVRNKVFDARNFFAPTRDDLKRNQFGTAVGGPIIKNRVFFFVSYEGIRQGLSSPTFATVPLNPWRTGDFSAALGGSLGTDALGRTVRANQVFDPLTSRSVTAGQVDPATGLTAVNGGVVREPFAGNVIPQSRINPASALILSRFIPTPNAAGTANNYAAQGVSTLNPDNLLIKFDGQLTPHDRIFLTGGKFFDRAPSSPGPYSPSDQGRSERTIPGRTGILGWNHTFSPTTLLDFRFSDSWAQGIFTSPTVDPERGGKDIVAELGIDPVNGGLPYHATTPGIPTVSITGFTGTAGLSHYPTGWRMNQMLWSANLSTLRGKHALQFGYALRYWKGGFFAQGDHRGSWTFNGSLSASPSVTPSSINAFGDFLLGYPFNSNRTAPWSWFYDSFRNHWAYVQDSFKVTPNLTLNLGLRYEFNPWPAERYRQFGVFAPEARGGKGAIIIADRKYVQTPYVELHPPTAAWMEVFDAKNLVLTAKDVGLPDTMRVNDKNNFAPRVGFAWNVKNTVVRGGYGIYHLAFDLNRNVSENVIPPFLDRTTPLFNTSPVPAYNIQNSFCRSTKAQFPGQCVAGDPFSFPAFPGINSTDPHGRVPYTQQWNLSIQHMFKSDWVAEAAYIGNSAHKLEGHYNLNNPLPGLGDIQARRPYPEFGTIAFATTAYNSNYQAMQLSLKHQFSHGFSILAGYTWSKWLDDLTEDSATPYNPTNFHLNKGVADLDIPHKFTTAYIWSVPSRHQSGALKYLTSGWEVSGIFLAQSGFPFTPTFAGDVTNTGVGVLPDRICDGKLSDRNPSRWYDVSCFVAPQIVPGTGGQIRTFGNSGRNILRMDRYYTFDPGVFKSMKFTERYNLQFRFEAFNVFNTVSFGRPGSTVNVPGAGVVTSAGPPRIIQFGLKFNF